MKILVTGVAGFIGMHLTQYLLQAGHDVVGIDSLNDYYSVALKTARLKQLNTSSKTFLFEQIDIAEAEALQRLFKQHRFDTVVHLAAQAGVRYSLMNPQAYTQSNLVGMANLLEAIRLYPVKHTLFASTSSVYGRNTKVPFKETDATDAPVSFYAATKKANEVMAYSYSQLYHLPMTGLRFFTVYGPWGRPDMAPWLFTDAILKGEPIKVFNQGQMQRDFTYVEDIVQGVCTLLDKPPLCSADDPIPFSLYNIGNHQPVPLLTFIETLERLLNRQAQKCYLPMQEGDVPITYACTQKLEAFCGFKPHTSLEEGLSRFVAWFKHYHGHA